MAKNEYQKKFDLMHAKWRPYCGDRSCPCFTDRKRKTWLDEQIKPGEKGKISSSYEASGIMQGSPLPHGLEFPGWRLKLNENGEVIDRY